MESQGKSPSRLDKIENCKSTEMNSRKIVFAFCLATRATMRKLWIADAKMNNVWNELKVFGVWLASKNFMCKLCDWFSMGSSRGILMKNIMYTVNLHWKSFNALLLLISSIQHDVCINALLPFCWQTRYVWFSHLPQVETRKINPSNKVSKKMGWSESEEQQKNGHRSEIQPKESKSSH